MKKESKIIAQMFDQIAFRYDMLNHLLSFGLDKKWREITVKEMNLKSKERVLDLATGTGDLAFLASKISPDSFIVGVDISTEMLKIAKKKIRKQNRSLSFQILASDALSLAFKDNSFDKVMIAFGIRNIGYIKGSFREFYRVLKPKGLLTILEFSLPFYSWIRYPYHIYMSYILPFFGGIISRNREAYSYFSQSVNSFYKPYEIENLIKRSGFVIIKSKPLHLGICHLYISVKK